MGEDRHIQQDNRVFIVIGGSTCTVGFCDYKVEEKMTKEDMIEAINELKEKRRLPYPPKEFDNLTELGVICIRLRSVGISDEELKAIKSILCKRLIDVHKGYFVEKQTI